MLPRLETRFVRDQRVKKNVVLGYPLIWLTLTPPQVCESMPFGLAQEPTSTTPEAAPKDFLRQDVFPPVIEISVGVSGDLGRVHQVPQWRGAMAILRGFRVSCLVVETDVLDEVRIRRGG